MKLTVQSPDLKGLTSLAAKFTNGKNLPILGSFLLAAEADKLTIAATDLDTSVRASIPATVEEAGSTCIEAKTFAGWAGKVSGEIALSLKGDNLHMKSGRAKATLATLVADQFPTLPPAPDETYTIPGFLDAVSSVAYAVSHDEVCPVLQGIHLEMGEGKLLLTATDGVRFGMADLPAPETQDKPWQAVTVPAPIFNKAKGDVAFTFDQSHFHLLADEAHYTSRLFDGKYPNVRQIVPQPTFTITANRADFQRALERLAIMVDNPSNPVRFYIAPTTLKMVASSTRGTVEEVLDIESDEKLQIGLNPTFVLDALKVIDAESVIMGFTDPFKPIFLYDGETATHAVLPITITRGESSESD